MLFSVLWLANLMVLFPSLKVRQQHHHARTPTIYPELFVAYRLLVFILVLNLRIYLFFDCMERTQVLLMAQAKPADV